MPEIEINGEKVPYSTRESEKASRPRIDSRLEGIRVVVPQGSGFEPEELIRNRPEWVLEKYREKKKFLESIEEKRFKDGEKFLYLDRELGLRIGRETSAIGDVEIKVTASESEEVEEEVRQLYREKARSIFGEKVNKYSDRIDGEFNEIQVRNQRTRWGSCTAKNNLSFNWRIIMAPEFVPEYIAVHELVHLEHSNHSQKFWKRVKDLFPRYEEAEEWISKNNHRLALSRKDVKREEN